MIKKKKTNKGLQKLTDIKDAKSLDAYMASADCKGYDEVFGHISGMANELSKAGKFPSKEWRNWSELLVLASQKYGTPKNHENVKRSLYQYNHSSILVVMHRGILENNIMPTITNIASETELSRTTVHKHLNDLKENGFDSEIRMQQKALVEQAITTLYKIGIRDSNPTALKYFIQFADPGLTKNAINNYIQINSIRLTQEDIKDLPQATLGAIEKIITEIKYNQD